MSEIHEIHEQDTPKSEIHQIHEQDTPTERLSVPGTFFLLSTTMYIRQFKSTFYIF